MLCIVKKFFLLFFLSRSLSLLRVDVQDQLLCTPFYPQLPPPCRRMLPEGLRYEVRDAATSFDFTHANVSIDRYLAVATRSCERGPCWRTQTPGPVGLTPGPGGLATLQGALACTTTLLHQTLLCCTQCLAVHPSRVPPPSFSSGSVLPPLL